MKSAEVKQAIKDRFWKDGKPLTKVFVASVSPRLLQYCESRALRENLLWTAVLHRAIYGEPRCASCGTSNIKFRNFRDGYGTHCSSKCAGADKRVDEKRKQTNLKTHGVERPQQHLPEVRRKFKRTMRRRYGVTYAGQSSALNKKAQKTSMEKFGVPYPAMSPEVKAKIRQTTFDRYGVEHIMQDRSRFEAQQKAGFKAVSFRIAGKCFKLRGSEHHVVAWMVKMGIPVEHILTTAGEGVPSIPWVDKNGGKHVYHPDMLVKHNGKWYIVEVKSTFTLGLLQHATGGRSGRYSEVQRKARACKEAGYRFKLFVAASDKRNSAHVAAIDNILDKTKSQIRQELKLLHPGKFRQL